MGVSFFLDTCATLARSGIADRGISPLLAVVS